MLFRIGDINACNWKRVVDLKPSPSQMNFIEPNALSIVQSKFEEGWHPAALYAGDEIVGFGMYGEFREQGETEVWLDRFMIDYRSQGLGYSKIFLRKLLERMKNEFNTNKVFLSVYQENKHAIRIYRSLGFQLTNSRDENGELIYILCFKDGQI
ncbi:diamine N-acetyltransferase [Scopulibacillus darangshiensis]|uniref:Diamine N-acetyltransferase n=1 Tax=Scopulibacillus darangshiensis TaxID=442528 RepID=A0A4R2P2D0_9BACL|nr:GNAT family N-acetyltransferase [Scopulibacillus darangshiensis]TCP28707.1 diamine N-acetyltransferase [Scopulibacillus darangshiensis]